VKVVAMWSGGKDSYLACQEAILKGFVVSSLINFTWKNVGKNRLYKVSGLINLLLKKLSRPTLYKYVPHEINPEIIATQAQAMEIPIVQLEVTWGTYEAQFKTTIRKLEPTVIEGVVWGAEADQAGSHSYWLHQLCDALGVKAIMPLRGRSEKQNLTDFVEKGYEAIIIVVDSDLLNKEWLGHKVDHSFLNEIRRLSRERGIPVTGCFNTLVTDAPLFKKRLKVLKSRKVSKHGYSVLDISKVELVEKTGICKDENS
jgi:diphthine-ammonia ligase